MNKLAIELSTDEVVSPDRASLLGLDTCLLKRVYGRLEHGVVAATGAIVEAAAGILALGALEAQERL